MSKKKRKFPKKRNPRPTSSLSNVMFCIGDTPHNRAVLEEYSDHSADEFLNEDGLLEGSVDAPKTILGRLELGR